VDFTWSFGLWKKICCRDGNQSPRYIVLYFAIDQCLLWMQKIRNQKFSAVFKKSNVNLLLGVIRFIRTKGFQTLLRVCVNANVCMFERTHAVHCVFSALCMVYLGNAVSWNRQNCNRQSMQRVQMLGHKCSFPKSHFLDSGRKKWQKVLRHWR